MILKQGTVLPVTGIGTGYLLVFIYGIIGWNIGFLQILKVPPAYLLLLIPAAMQFSYKDFILQQENTEHYYIRYRILFILRLQYRHSFRRYSSIVLRVVKKNYNVRQGVGAGISGAEGRHSEKYLALVGYYESERIEICRGTSSELQGIIKNVILPLKIPVYLGAPKKGYEYQMK